MVFFLFFLFVLFSGAMQVAHIMLEFLKHYALMNLSL